MLGVNSNNAGRYIKVLSYLQCRRIAWSPLRIFTLFILGFPFNRLLLNFVECCVKVTERIQKDSQFINDEYLISKEERAWEKENEIEENVRKKITTNHFKELFNSIKRAHELIEQNDLNENGAFKQDRN
ncbi:hypothetical protein TNCV_2960291 [Trichonephila clavipes]|nr:hypothetical protein TNCV_2960291 [Trichonephila clavipes]